MALPSPDPFDTAAMVQAVLSASPTEDVLDRLGTAVALTAEIRESADAVLDHFVEAARQAGTPWSQIGGALGVTKQAAQQKFVMPSFTRFTDRAHRVLELAHEEAERLRHNFVGLEHVVIGLAREKQSVGGKTLRAMGVSADALRARTEAMVPVGSGLPWGDAGQRPLTARAKRALGETALREALKLGHNYVGTEHLLLAIANTPDSVGAAVLTGLGVDLKAMKVTTLDVLRSHLADR